MDNREVLIRAKQTLVDKTNIALDMANETKEIQAFTARKLFLLLQIGAGAEGQEIPEKDVERLLQEVGKLDHPTTGTYKFSTIKHAVTAILEQYNNLQPPADR